MNNVLIIGSIPPPLGGVSVFVKRTFDSLSEAGDNKVYHCGNQNVFKLVSLLVFSRIDVVHLNTMNLVVLLVLGMFGGLSKTIVYDHNHSRFFSESSWINSWAKLFLISKCSAVKVANLGLRKNYFKHVDERKIDLFSPFVPPSNSAEKGVLEALPASVTQLFQGSRQIILTSAWKNVIDSDGREVYGFTSILDVAEDFTSREDIHFVFFLGIDENSDYLVKRVEGLKNCTMFIGQYETWPLIKRSAVFVRATTTDGDSVSIREAMYFGVPVVASDVVARPDGVSLYQLNDLQGLRDSLVKVL